MLTMKVNKLFSWNSLKEIENMLFSVLLSSYRNTRGSLGDLEKAVETCTRLSARVQREFLVSLTSVHSCFYNSAETRNKFSIS